MWIPFVLRSRSLFKPRCSEQESGLHWKPWNSTSAALGVPPWSSGSVLDHISLPPVFESRPGHIWRLFRLSFRLITFGGRSAHLTYLVHKSGHKTSIIIIITSTALGSDPECKSPRKLVGKVYCYVNSSRLSAMLTTPSHYITICLWISRTILCWAITRSKSKNVMITKMPIFTNPLSSIRELIQVYGEVLLVMRHFGFWTSSAPNGCVRFPEGVLTIWLMIGRISDRPFVPLNGLRPTNCGVKWVWNHSSPIDMRKMCHLAICGRPVVGIARV